MLTAPHLQTFSSGLATSLLASKRRWEPLAGPRVCSAVLSCFRLHCPCSARGAHNSPGSESGSRSSSSGGSSGGSGFCAGKANGLYPMANNKNAFQHCLNGVTYQQNFEARLIFDTSCDCCNWGWTWPVSIPESPHLVHLAPTYSSTIKAVSLNMSLFGCKWLQGVGGKAF